jgi:hypothetical protein
MLNAILHGKKRGTGLEGIRLSEDFNGAEDTLTSTIFERLLYLPDETLIAIIFDPSAWTRPSTKPPKEIKEYEFWPRWEPAKVTPVAELDTPNPSEMPDDSLAMTEDQKFIQPDLVVQFDDRVLIIEAKRWDFRGMQIAGQLARQYARASILFPGMPAWLLAVGGLPDGRLHTKSTLRASVLAELRNLDWRLPDAAFHFAVLAWHELLKTTIDAVGDLPAYRRMMIDLRKGLSAHGIHVEPLQWLGDLTSTAWRNAVGNIASSSATFCPGLARTLSPLGISPSSLRTLCPEEPE